MEKSSSKLLRRTFLAALGLGVAAPLASKMARLAVAAPSGPPVRLLNLFIPHGVPWEFAEPMNASGGLDLMAKGESGVFAPLAPYAAHVNYLRGIAMAHDQSNHAAIDTMWTGSAVEGDARPDSFDYLIANELKVKPFALGAVPYSEFEGFNVDSFLLRHGGQWVRAQSSPVAAADEMFFGLGSNDAGAVDESKFRDEAMDLTRAQIERLSARVSGLTSEENKLKTHLEAIASLKASSTGGVISCSERPEMMRVEAMRGQNGLDPALFGKLLDAQLEAAGYAMLCGVGRVISLQALWVNSNLLFNFEGGPGLAQGHHLGLSHGVRGDFAKAQRWFMERLATVLLPILDQDDPADPGKKVIDNTIIYLSSEISDPNDHNSQAGETYVAGSPMYTCLPQILIGGGGGKLKTGGNVINVEEDRPHTDVLATIAQVMGAPMTQIGDGPVQSITEVLA